MGDAQGSGLDAEPAESNIRDRPGRVALATQRSVVNSHCDACDTVL